MKLQSYFVMLSLPVALAACGGGGGDDGPSRTAPVAKAGAAQTVKMGSVVTLDGGASVNGSEGGALVYAWSMTQQPPGSGAILSAADVMQPRFTADMPGHYKASLTVSDNTGASVPDTVTITATTDVPVAIIEAPSQASLGQTVILDGSGSVAPTGSTGSLQYQWTLVAPERSQAVLNDAAAAKPSFVADKEGRYQATLSVSHNGQASEPRQLEVNIKTTNRPPVPVAKVLTAGGAAVTPTNDEPPYRYQFERGVPVVLDASASTDPDGDKLSYRWYLFHNSPGAGYSVVGLSQPQASRQSPEQVFAGEKMTFTPDVSGDWSVQLIAFDGTTTADTSVKFKTTKPAGVPNSKPVARLLPPEAPRDIQRSSDPVWLSPVSYDVDGEALTHYFRWVETPADFTPPDLSEQHSFMSFTPTKLGKYVIELISEEAGGSKLRSDPELTELTVKDAPNRAPTAITTIKIQTVLIGDRLVFDATGSADMDGDELFYQWTLIDRPDDSKAVLQNSDKIASYVVTDKPGIYMATLVVTDSKGARSKASHVMYARGQAKSKNNPPVVAAAGQCVDGSFHNKYTVCPDFALGSEDQPIVAGVQVRLQANGVIDPDSDNLYHLWSLEQPEGNGSADAILSQSGLIKVEKPGMYTATFVTSDGMARSEPVVKHFKAVERQNFPTLLLEFNATGAKPEAAQPGSDNVRIQQALPHSHQIYTNFNAASNWNKSLFYTLTAFGGDYTVTGLGTSQSGDGTGDGKVYVDGLENGQIIRQGTSVRFALRDTNTSPNTDAEWFFEIQERPDFRFHVKNGFKPKK
ncbi:hypothetical protein EV679_2373 [Kerstersia gyiorum]|uniref:PKD domain-containing protein n=1 Tax=Kerstersia gyiorum TaxID=206506 RepID=A0A4Q7MN35_9BURK|nr:PKD domain-containing protein [Kerstersia gyiorum]KAB0544617.1 hypothetical protein F7P85_04090 [Kerstersia gyiorum]RZS69766.1 hypothetical protein EV679_2373 [Kerstersia gyiorum]